MPDPCKSSLRQRACSRTGSYLATSAGRVIRRSLHTSEVVPHKVVHCSCTLQEGQQVTRVECCQAGGQGGKTSIAVHHISGKALWPGRGHHSLSRERVQSSACGLSGCRCTAGWQGSKQPVQSSLLKGRGGSQPLQVSLQRGPLEGTVPHGTCACKVLATPSTVGWMTWGGVPSGGLHASSVCAASCARRQGGYLPTCLKMVASKAL